MKYLNFQQQKDIPDSAENLFAQHDTFQKFVDSLDLIVGWYNEVGCKGETTRRLFHALARRPWEAAPGSRAGAQRHGTLLSAAELSCCRRAGLLSPGLRVSPFLSSVKPGTW